LAFLPGWDSHGTERKNHVQLLGQGTHATRELVAASFSLRDFERSLKAAATDAAANDAT
jgi:hypothetical protein